MARPDIMRDEERKLSDIKSTLFILMCEIIQTNNYYNILDGVVALEQVKNKIDRNKQ